MNETVEFLKKFYPTQFWVLTAIRPDKKGIETKTFSHETETECKEWLKNYNGNRNLYFSVNQPAGPVAKKLYKHQIHSMHYLHVDVDPRVGEDVEDERIRILKLLKNLPGNLPAPSCIVDSGGGYNAYFKLLEPVLIEGNLEKAADAERYNRHIEMLLNADNCFNLDRIMRLPYTLNIPDAVKLKKGRVPVESQLIEFNDNAYDINQFEKAPSLEPPTLNDRPTNKIVVDTSNLKRLKSVDELDQWGVDDRVKVLIVQGGDPNEPTKYPSRSEALFDVLCQLARAEVPTETMFSVIMDPDFCISESVLEKKGKATTYATRQIERAKEEAYDPWLRKLNERHAVIRNWGGKCRVIEEVYDHAMKRTRLTKQSFDDFRNSYMNESVEVGMSKGKPVSMPAGKWWLQHSKRRQYDTLVFLPGQDIPGTYNLWTGFACESIKGDCSLFLRHIQDNICCGVEEYYNYIMGWMARCTQKPDTQGNTAIVLRGREGTGKSLFATLFGSLWGRHFLHISDSKHLVGSFNAHLRDCVVLFGDEAFFAGDVKHEAVLKTLISESTLTVEPKGIDVEVCSNFVHLIMGSNKEWVVPAGGDNRRFLVLDVSEKQIQNIRYFKAILNQMANGGLEALLFTLMNYDLSEFDVRTVPKTEALQDQKLHSLDPLEEWWYQKLYKGLLLEEHMHWTGEVPSSDLVRSYVEYTKSFNIVRRGNETAIGRFFRKICPKGYPRRERKMVTMSVDRGDGFGPTTMQKRIYHHMFPTLLECRDMWVATFGPVDWPPEPERQLEIDNKTPF